MRESFVATSYSYYHWSSRPDLMPRSNIVIKGTDGASCTVWFQNNPTASLLPATRSGVKKYNFYYYHWQFDQLIDMLRNESPITVEFNDDSGYNNSRITTGTEPVGDGEIS